MALVRKGPRPPFPNYDQNVFWSEKTHDHCATINTDSPLPSTELRSHLEADRDHYSATALVAGIDPITKAEVPFPEYSDVEALFDRGIAAACDVAAGMSGSVHATVRIRRHNPERGDSSGNAVIVSVTES